MVWTPKTKQTIDEHIRKFRTLFEKKTPLVTLCDVFDATVGDLQMFVRFNMTDLQARFEAFVTQQRKLGAEQGSPVVRRKYVRAPVQQPARPEQVAPSHAVRLGTRDQLLYDLIMGGIGFREDDRPFNRLNEDEQELVRQQVARFMDIHEKAPKKAVA